MRVLATRGMDGATVAAVATEAGVSVGLVQRYFRTKDEMLLVTSEFLGTRLVERLNRTWGAGGSPRERIRDCLLQFVPLDAERRAEVAIYVAFCGHAVASESLRRVLAASHAAIRSAFAEWIRDAQHRGELRVPDDPALEATSLWSLVDGLSLQVYADPDGVSAELAEQVVDRRVAQLFD